MKCPECKKSNSRVLRTEIFFDGKIKHRVRECLHCRTLFRTEEKICTLTKDSPPPWQSADQTKKH